MSEETTTTNSRSRLWIGIGLAGLGVFLLLAMLIGGALISLFAVQGVATGPSETISLEMPTVPAPPAAPAVPAGPAIPAAPALPAFTGNVDVYEREMAAYEREMEQWAAHMEREMDTWGVEMEQEAAAFEREMDRWSAQMERDMDQWGAQMERSAQSFDRIEVRPVIRTRPFINGGRFFGNLLAVALVLLGVYLVKRQQDTNRAAPATGPEADRPNV